VLVKQPVPWYPSGVLPFDLEDAVNQQSWGWLFDLPPRLNVVIEVVDARHAPLFPAGPTPAAAAVRGMLSTDPVLVSAISAAMHSKIAQPVSLDAFEAVCFGLAPTGVLVLARELANVESAAECRQDLESIGSWLTGAIETTVTSPPNAISAEPYRMASLRRILSDAMARGSVRNVVGAFVEALGVWDDVRVRGYAAGASGGFFQYVSPVGTLPTALPAELDDALVPRDSRMVRLSREEIGRLGLASEPGDMLIQRVFTGIDVAWLLVFSGTIDGREQVRLTLYSDMLRESLNEVIATATNRLVAGVTRQQPLNEPIEDAAQAALGQLTAAVTGYEAALVVTAGGRQALAVGNTDLFMAHEGPLSPDQLLVTFSDAGSDSRAVITRESTPFTAFEREIVRAGLATVHPWLQMALLQSNLSERRRRVRPVDALLEQLAADAVHDGRQALVVVISVDAKVLRPGLMQTWLGKIRTQTRAYDFAGILSDSEIALLLCDASAGQAGVVSARIRRLLEADDSAGVLIRPAIGVTSCSPEAALEGSVVQAARAHAAAFR
jgi:hypothetical protein